LILEIITSEVPHHYCRSAVAGANRGETPLLQQEILQ
jgi:hypothetical protein